METPIHNIDAQERPRYRVLLVDDDQHIHDMMELLVRQTEYLLSSATNAQDAIEMIDRDPPDILITDAMMPGESGFSLIERVKGSPGARTMPIILWTILEDPDGSVMDASKKADILVNKPFYLSDIMQALEQAKGMIRRSVTNEGALSEEMSLTNV